MENSGTSSKGACNHSVMISIVTNFQVASLADRKVQTRYIQSAKTISLGVIRELRRSISGLLVQPGKRTVPNSEKKNRQEGARQTRQTKVTEGDGVASQEEHYRLFVGWPEKDQEEAEEDDEVEEKIEKEEQEVDEEVVEEVGKEVTVQ